MHSTANRARYRARRATSKARDLTRRAAREAKHTTRDNLAALAAEYGVPFTTTA